MLPVAVHGHAARRCRTVCEQPEECGFEGMSLAVIPVMVQNRAVQLPLRRLKIMLILRRRAVINEQNIGKALLLDAADGLQNPFIRIKGRNHDSYCIKLLHACILRVLISAVCPQFCRHCGK